MIQTTFKFILAAIWLFVLWLWTLVVTELPDFMSKVYTTEFFMGLFLIALLGLFSYNLFKVSKDVWKKKA
ncbi:hypothetical protein Erwinia_phage_Tian_00074 [Erwinia phage Tian]|uniref:Uncharacterized protein n=5 Tax=Caudoviricetes TaxID=2731619 RepID=A0A6B9RJA9_9CAUD|nr:hypothetical protein LINGLNFE_00048 [Enterobacter phage phi63_307]QHI00631.1 hypothetical protein [Salmonella phage vB_SenM_SB18]WJN64365.1 hypothetical protein Erwinia_phage_Panisse_00012 [Erwinia phage Panisse]WJN64710.1 hypothetical protein Erwinia_phage_Pistou_00073 [Erwinia phage Pistou]WJN64989.1 hypothetical protein Erwinia_phage_Tian_00074 [Erwinia phage Tian]